MTERFEGLALRGIQHRYDDTPVLEHVDLDVGAGEIVCLLGASGSGKSTLLRLVAGLEPLQAGAIYLDGTLLADVTLSPPPEARRFGFLFQDHVLFPHLTVRENVAFGLHGVAASEQATVVAEQLEQVGLAEYAGRYPHTLSGGQQQRIALARALAPGPRVMLLDEPFASVDATLRRRLREDARQALKARGVPTILVTHDAQEALEMADRIAILSDGAIIQQGAPQEVWEQPANRFVAELFGDAAAIPGTWCDDGVHTAFGVLPTAAPRSAAAECTVVVRPSHVRLAAGSGPAVLADLRFFGDHFMAFVGCEGQTLKVVCAEKPPVAVGDSVELAFDPAGILVYC